MTTIELTSGMAYIVDEDIEEIMEWLKEVGRDAFAIQLTRKEEKHWFILAHITHMWTTPAPESWKVAPIG